MKRVISSLILAFAILNIVQAQQSAPKVTGRYQLVAATVPGQIGSGSEAEHCLFLIDTETGRVWKFQTGGAIQRKQADGTVASGVLADTFQPVNFGPVDVQSDSIVRIKRDRP